MGRIHAMIIGINLLRKISGSVSLKTHATFMVKNSSPRVGRQTNKGESPYD